jgi:ABC-type nitrate/sulfonate/bicarbonate transport system substrate-binding protein
MNFNILLKLVLDYVEKHPEVLQKLIAQLFEAIINALETHNAATAKGTHAV